MLKEEKVTLNRKNPKPLRMGVFLPSFIIIAGSALLGLANNKVMTDTFQKVFLWTLSSFGWLYQIISVVALILVGFITFTKLGKLRFGGAEAKPKYSFMAWFAMALTGGIATGIVTWGVNEPIIYFGNIWGELAQTGVTPQSATAAIFALARVFYNWTFVPYAMYSLCGLVVAYMYFNKKKPLSVASSLIPLFGDKITTGVWAGLVDTLAILGIALGLSASLGAGLTLVGAGLEIAYGIKQGPVIWFILTIIITATFSVSALVGLDRGIKFCADLNAKLYYVLLIALFLIGPTLYILRTTTAGMAYWLQNFWIWGLDPIDIGGEALVMWWTLYDWAIWIAYAPLMGIFLAVISYGRTIRQFMVINWIMPSVFSIIWFGIFGSTAILWQSTGVVDLIGSINNNGAVAALWTFLQHVPFGVIFIPAIMFALIISFSTCADSITRTVAGLCTKDIAFDEEPASWQKLAWAVSIGLMAYLMVTFGGGVQGVDGVKYLSAAGGFVVLFLFVLQVAACIKMFYIDKVEE